MSFFNTRKDLTSGLDLVSKKVSTPRYTYSALVRSVFLDYKEIGGRTFPPGTIEVQPVGANLGGIIYAYPLDEMNTTIPIINEIVDVFTFSSLPFYRRKNFSDTINSSQVDSMFLSGVGSKPLPNSGITDYKTGMGGTNSTSNDPASQGKIFKKQYINRLKYFEGDSIIQSRFGQSIRLSGYNNDFSESHPTIIIRNKESSLANTKKGYKTVTEDINRDGSTIAITSGKYKSKFVPGSINKSGKSDFKLKAWEKNTKYALEDYPKELDGDQIIITSGRLIFSSRANEMIFWSKGWYGIVSDSAVSIDAAKGFTLVSHNGDIDIEAKEKRINFNIGKSGTINIGTGDGKVLTPVVDGKALVMLLGKIVDEIQNLGLAGIITPAGPSTGLNPASVAALSNIRNQLASLLSKTVYVAK